MSDISLKSTSKFQPGNKSNLPKASSNSAKHAPNLRNWCWTLNNYTDEELFELETLCDNADNEVRGICWGHEVGDNETPHLQGYLELKIQRMCGRRPRPGQGS